MQTLFGRTFGAFAAALIGLSLVLTALFGLALSRSMTVWNVNRTRHIRSAIAAELTREYRATRELQPDRVAVALDRFLTPGVAVSVLSPQNKPLLIFDQGSVIDLHSESEVASIVASFGVKRAPALAVIDGQDLVGFLAVETLGFLTDAANRAFVESVVLSGGIALVTALILASAAALIASRKLTNHAREMSTRLSKLAHGEREVRFPSMSVVELHEISNAAGALQRQLRHEETLRRQWAQDVAHDLRTPIAALKSQFEGMLEGAFEPSMKRLQALFEELTTIEQLVESLRELSRLESPELVLRTEVETIETVVERSVERTRRVATCLVECSIDAPSVAVLVDRALIDRALTNVLENAVRYADQSQPIRVAATGISPRTIAVSVTNAGSVPEHEREHLFNRLYRGSNARGTRGSGLGLSIARTIVNRHGGDIHVEHPTGKTRVTLTLPIWPAGCVTNPVETAKRLDQP